MNADIREAEDQGFGMFQDPDNLMRAINSANGELNRSSDEFLPHMSSVKAVPENLNSLAYNLGLLEEFGVRSYIDTIGHRIHVLLLLHV